jgi:hypothetical protein
MFYNQFYWLDVSQKKKGAQYDLTQLVLLSYLKLKIKFACLKKKPES